MIPDFKTFIRESIWSDMQDRSMGKAIRREDDINLMSGEDFCDYLNYNYISKSKYKILYSEHSKCIHIPILNKFIGVLLNLSYDYEDNTITMNYDEVESLCPELCKKIKENFKVDKEYVNIGYTKFIISPSDGSECTNRFFVDVINFIIDNGDEHVSLIKKKHINESIWSDMQDRSMGKIKRKEDKIITNEELKNRIQKLYKEQGEGDTLDVSSLTNFICDDFSNIFRGFKKVKHIIGLEDWDVSHVEDMHSMFYGCTNFNSDLSKWDVSRVEDMGYMFYNCTNFNSDLSKWDVSRVEDMGGMFWGCEKFNSDLSNWDVSSVNNMISMFNGCKNFNSDLSNWAVGKVTIMYQMFEDCWNFNFDLSKWDVSNVEDISSMFYNCKNFNSDLSNWNVSKVTDMYKMFWGCEKFNSDLSKWNVSNVKNMYDMFDGCNSLKNKPSWYKNE